MEPVDVLCDDAKPGSIARSARERDVCRVRYALLHDASAPSVPFPHEPRITCESFRSGEILGAVVLPQSAGAAKGGHTGLRADAGAGEDDNAMCLAKYRACSCHRFGQGGVGRAGHDQSSSTIRRSASTSYGLSTTAVRASPSMRCRTAGVAVSPVERMNRAFAHVGISLRRRITSAPSIPG